MQMPIFNKIVPVLRIEVDFGRKSYCPKLRRVPIDPFMPGTPSFMVIITNSPVRHR